MHRIGEKLGNMFAWRRDKCTTARQDSAGLIIMGRMRGAIRAQGGICTAGGTGIKKAEEIFIDVARGRRRGR